VTRGERSWRQRFRLAAITLLGGALLRLLAHSWRIRVVHGDYERAARAGGRPVIFAFWHGRLLPLLWWHRKQGIHVVISEHGDGEIIARVAEGLGYQTVRGSSSRGAERALLGASRAASDGHDVAFTPDGPRGPAESVAPGALIVSQRSGVPILPLAAGASRAWRLRSWDRFLIPKPFARVTVVYGEPLAVRAPAARDAIGFADELAGRIHTATSRADEQ
jgi:lysophospholipid acyltransferase (LPLAT)-like uncharacterized protein